MTPTQSPVGSAVLIGLGLVILTLRQRGQDRAAGFDRMAGYVLLVAGTCGVFISVAGYGAYATPRRACPLGPRPGV